MNKHILIASVLSGGSTVLFYLTPRKSGDSMADQQMLLSHSLHLTNVFAKARYS